MILTTVAMILMIFQHGKGKKGFDFLRFSVLKGLRGEIALSDRILYDLEAILAHKTAPKIKQKRHRFVDKFGKRF